ncbi:MAG: hypothetical protein EOL95_10455 [Bacteroidia bacterium]|nr:hypothetical protein [Bacteroidia bacterium]
MAVTLTRSGITFTFLIEEISSVKSRTSQMPDRVSITGTGAMGAFIYNYEGATKDITVTGYLIDANTSRTSTGSITTIAEQKKWLEGLFAGSNTKITFSSNYEAETPDTETGFVLPYVTHYKNTTVIGGTIDFEEIEGEVNWLPFTMTLMVGA